MAEPKNTIKKNHTVKLENRGLLSVEGVNDVGSFDAQSVMLFTDHGGLCVKGDSLHISKLSLDTGEVVIDGKISAMIYTEAGGKKRGVLERLFK